MIYSPDIKNELAKAIDSVRRFVEFMDYNYELNQCDANITMPSLINEENKKIKISIMMELKPRPAED